MACLVSMSFSLRKPILRGCLALVSQFRPSSSSKRNPAKAELGEGDGLRLEDLTLDSRAVAARYKYRGTPSYPIVTPIFHSSTYRLGSCEDFYRLILESGSVYSRISNETTETAEVVINTFEEGAGSLVFSSGMAAITTVFICFLKAGDHVIFNNPIYSGTVAFLKAFSAKYQIELSVVPSGCSAEEYRKKVKPNTRILYAETPCNPGMQVTDLEALGQLGQSLDGVLTVVDSTFGSCYLQQPIKYGIDISLHSCTKYMGGHSDLIGGAVTTRTVEQWKALKAWQGSLLGNPLSPHDASLLLRSLRTLPIRMLRHSENALKVAKFLEGHRKVLRVAYPGLSSHPHHDVAKKQMKAFGGMIMAEVKGGSKGGQIVAESVRLITLAVSLGGVDSLIEHPYSMTHGPYLMDEEETKEAGISEGMLRISIGIEDPDELIHDLDQALAKIPE